MLVIERDREFLHFVATVRWRKPAINSHGVREGKRSNSYN